MEAPLIAFIVMAVINIPLFILIGKVIFGSWEDFWDAVKFWLTPDALSLFTGEYWDDIWAEFKLGFFVVTCGACVYGQLWLIVKWFGDAAAA